MQRFMRIPDEQFAQTNIWYLKDFASLLGPNKATFHSQDDKAGIPIGITAAHKQSPLLMIMGYKAILNDYDFVVAPHILIPSIIVAVEAKKGSPETVTHSGSTYLTLQSAKHSGSSAFSICQTFFQHYNE